MRCAGRIAEVSGSLHSFHERQSTSQPPGLLAHKQPQLLPTKTAINGCDAQGTTFYDKDKRKPPTPPGQKQTLESENEYGYGGG